MVGQEGAVLVQDQDEAEHGEGGEDEEEEVPEQVGRPEGGRVKARHDLNLLRACRPLTDQGGFSFFSLSRVILVNDDMYIEYVPQGEDEKGGDKYGKSQGEGDAKGISDHVDPVSGHSFK